MKIIYDVKNNSLRAIDFNDDTVYAFSELEFYIPKNINNNYIFCMISDVNNVDFISLKLKETSGNYSIYTLSTSGGQVKNFENPMKISLTFQEVDTSYTSEGFLINLDFTSFNYLNQINVLTNLSEEISNKISKMEELTKINLKIYEDVREVAGIDN